MKRQFFLLILTLTLFSGKVLGACPNPGSNQTMCQGTTLADLGGHYGDATTITWSSSAGGTFSDIHDKNSTWTPPAGYTGIATLTINIVGGACDGGTDSKTVTVRPTPTASISGTTSVCKNATDPVITFTNPQSLGITVSYNINGGSTLTKNVGASTTATVDASTTTVGTFVYTLESVVYQTAPTCSNTISGSATVTVDPTPTLSTAALSATVCEGSGAVINMTGLLAGTTYTISYKIAGVSQSDITGVVADGSGNASFISATLTAANEGDILQITNETLTNPATGCSSAISKNVTLHVSSPAVGGTVASNQAICSGSSPADLVVSGNTGSVTKWQKSSDAGFTSPTDIAVTSTTLTGATIGNLTSGAHFRAVVTNGACSDYSTSVLVTVDPVSVGGSSSAQEICSGSSPADIVLTGNTGTVIKWQKSSDAGFSVVTDIPVASATLPGATIGSLTSTTYFRAEVQSGVCSVTNSLTVVVTVDPVTVGGTIASGQTICSDVLPADLVLSGNTGSVLKWQKASDLAFTTPVDIIVTSTTLTGATIGNLSANTYFRASVQSGICSQQYSASILITVNPLPSSITGTTTVCQGSTTILSDVTGGGTWSSGATGVATIDAGGVVTGVSAGSSLIRYTLASGCFVSTTVTVNPAPTVTNPATASTCSGTGPNISLTSSISSNFTWTIGTITGSITGAGAGSGGTINQTLTNPSSVTSGSVQYLVTPTSTTTSCVGPAFIITVTVDPVPAAITGTMSVCSGLTTTLSDITPGGTWSSVTPGVATIAAGGIVTGVSGGTSQIRYTMGTGCYVSSTVTVNPLPIVTNSSTASTCNGTGPNISLTSSVPGSFTWTIGTITGSITGASAGSGGTINQTLTNPNNSTAGTVEYLVIPTATIGSCVGPTFTITVTVNPTPAVTNTATAVTCSGTGPGISLTASATSNFAWTVSTITGSITGASAASGNTLNQPLTNPSNTVSGTVNYLVTPTSTAGSCVGSASTITITVNPAPAVTNSATTSICSGTGPNIALNSTIPSNYSWTVGAITGSITGASAGSGGTINQILTNPGNSASGTVQYLVTPTSIAGSCSGSAFTITVTVYPTPSVTNPATSSICGGTSPNIVLTSSTPGTFSWTIGAITGGIIGASAGSGGTINQTLVNPSSLTAGTLEYLVTPTATTGSCIGSAYSIVVSVNPLPRLTGASQAAAVCGGSTATINLLGLLPGTASTVSYDVNSVAQPPVTGVLANGSGSASFSTDVLTAVNNGQILRITSIQTTSSTPGCSQTFTQDLTMSVDPPTIGGTISSAQTICSGSAPTDLVLSGNTGSLVKWQKASDVVFSSPIDISVTSTTLAGATIGNLTSNTYFRAVVKSGVCSQANSSSILVTVNALPVPTIGGPASVNVASTGNIYSTESGMTGYSWIVSAGGVITTGTGTNSITVTWNNPGAQTVRINYTNSNLCTAATSTVYNVTVNAKPVATNVSILGDPRSGLTLNGAYVYSDADGDIEGTTSFQWYTGISSSGAGSAPIASATSQTYTLKDAELGTFIGFSVTPKALTGATPGNTVTIITWVGPVINDAPRATSVAISGSLNVNGVLIGHYTYSDKEGDIEATSTFQWYISNSLAGPYSPIAGETFSTHLIGNNEQANYFKFFVTPVAATGTLNGIEVQSAGYGPANSQPYADNVLISGIPNLGSTLTGSYIFHDVDGNPQGATTFRWLRNGTIPISGATNTTYLLVSADEGYTISFEVTPVSSAGFPTSGTPVLSSPTASVVDPSPAVPFADQVCITGIRKPNQVLTGKYYYNFYKSEGTSTFRWLKNNIAIPGANSINYTLTASDISSGQEITFEVTPVSSNSIPKVGPAVKSNPIARIKLIQASYSLADPAFTLVANVSGGVFSGQGVSAGVFSPASADTTGSPHKISYLLNISNPYTTCSQQASDSIYVVPIHAYFVNLKSIYCYDGKRDTISVTNVPATATNLKFSSSNHALIVDSIPPFRIIIDPKLKRPGISLDTLYFSFRYSGSYFPIAKTFETDSVGAASIKNLNAGAAYCTNSTPFTLYPSHTGTGGVFTGPVKGSTLDPSLGFGNTIVNFTYTNSRTTCFSSVNVPITINPAPKVSFVPKSVCIVTTQDTVKFFNYSTSSDPFASWLWEFFDAGGSTTSKLKEPGNLFRLGGQHVVSLTATTIKNCSVKKDSTIDIGIKPIVDFRWEKECFQTNPPDSIILINTTFSSSKISSSTWNFFDGKPVLYGDTIKYPKTASGYLSVRLKIKTPYANCEDSIFRQVYIRPSISLSTDDYFQNFESGNGGWVKDYVKNNSWSFGTPSRKTIKHAASGVNAWFTNFTKDSLRSESIISPCFDFTNIQRPMISIKLWKAFDWNRDGAALQYKIGDKGTWQYIGTLGDGITWYNSPLIKGRPGGDQLGWTAGTTTADRQDTSWVESRHTLDELSGYKNVIFRIAYGSDGNAFNNDGIAFDDISIRRRTRSVMLEHFTNNSSSSSIVPTSAVTVLAKNRSKDVINIQYHTNFPGSDPYYNDNPGDASARFLFYGLSRAPYTILDGGTRFNADKTLNYANIYDYLIADLDSNDLTRRSLTDPTFIITLNDTLVGGVVKIKGQITALKAINAENVTLYLVVTESQNTVGNKTYNNVFRKFIPDAAGTSLNKTWAKNDTYSIPEKTWVMQKVANNSKIEIIAFLQNNITKEIYQAKSGIQNNILVGIDNLFANNGRGFSLYPNPSVQRLTIAFEDILQAQTEIMIYDFKGTVVKTYRIGTGESVFTIGNVGLPSGIYLVRVKSGGVDWGFRKLLISKD